MNNGVFVGHSGWNTVVAQILANRMRQRWLNVGEEGPRIAISGAQILVSVLLEDVIGV